MLARRIIPCLEVADGQTMKNATAGGGDPVELARFYSSAGADELLMMFSSAAELERPNQMQDLLEGLCADVFLPIIIGGGIEVPAQARALLRAGADRVVIDAAAIRKPETIDAVARLIGSERLVVGMVVKPRRERSPDDSHADQPLAASGYEVLSGDGERSTGRDAVEWACEAVSRGAGELLVIDEATRRAAGGGYELDLLAVMSAAVPVPVLAFGGARHAGHFVSAFEAGLAGAVASGIFHSRETSIKRIKRDCLDAGLPIRPLPVEEEAGPGAAAPASASSANTSPAAIPGDGA
ncbi:MAG: imidazole glycerol phosphate synthase subunit HisF [Vicinamibacterales bacterium]